MTLYEIAEYLGGELHGPDDLEISGPAKIENAETGHITFIANPKYKQYLSSTKASAVIVDDKIKDVEMPHIVVKDAYMGFLMLLKLYSPPQHEYIKGISGDAYIDKSAKISSSSRIASMVYIGPNVKIGENSIIYPGVVLLRDVTVGNDSVLYPNVSVREECVIGDRVILHNGCVIGSDGFGFAPDGEKYKKIPQLGRVVVEDDVEIGANTTIDRATMGDTLILKGSKIDNLVQIAHNVTIGENSIVAAQTGISGSTHVGSHVTIAGQVGIVGHIKIGDNAMIAAKSGISKDVPAKAVYFGIPALPIMQQKRIDVSLKHLPDMIKKIHQLENEIIQLKEELSKLNNRSVDD